MENEKIQDIERLTEELLDQDIHIGGRGYYQVLDEIPVVGKKNLFFCRCLQEGKRYLIEFASPTLTHVELQKFLRRALFLMVLDPQKGMITARDFSMDPTRSFVILNWVVGKNLNSLLKHIRLSVDEAMWILSDLAVALDHLADFTFVHRNIHPGSILIRDGTGHAYLEGLDYLTQSDFLQTQLDTNLQYVEYASPELIRYLLSPNTPMFLTPASDIYSLGCVFYHMITGHPPFPGRDNLAKWIRRPQIPKLKVPFPNKAQKKQCQHLIKNMMTPHYYNRWSAFQIRDFVLNIMDKSDRPRQMARFIFESEGDE